MSDNLRAALYHADYTAIMASRTSGESPALVRVVGKHCESGDIVVEAGYLPANITPGDLVVVAATGAYCHSLASNYNVVGRPALVIVQGGDIHTSLRAETLDDLMHRDVGLGLAGAQGENT
jgi:diaminopimelate decarboxylase